ncbi:hypothetical protein KAR91_71985 [Candidatus Pacearchaeota archaeon]|nr:hypothetical protein [Candidatus Pacearchaeota archaeon]
MTEEAAPVEKPEKKSLLKDWIKFKKAEKKAKANRVAIEPQIEKEYDTSFKGKSKTFKEEDLGFSVNIAKKSQNSTLDQELWKTVRLEIPEKFRPEKIKFELDEDGFEWLKKEKPEIYKKVSGCVTTKDKKATIKVEKI